MIKDRLKIYLIILIFFSAGLILVGIYLNNKDYNKVFFINDNEELMKKYTSSTPVKIEVMANYLPTYVLNNPAEIIDIWKKIIDLPKYNMISTDSSKPLIYGYIYFLDGGKTYYEISNDLIINNLTYGSGNDEEIIYVKEKLMKKIFSLENISKALINKNNKIIIFNHNNGVHLKDYNMIYNLYNIIQKSTVINSTEEIGKILGSEILYTIKILRDDVEFIVINVFDENYFSLYYLNNFLYLQKGDILPFLRTSF
ncbi:DUF3919 family protein [Marinitoga litoralis]|jgi:hypothetical protein|uniref:DUF3919 family protein n=1 Tax=Marinitoga litoralis TaxID=570855 RepID=UPI001960FBCF|nr:DUF3919 family protein [Marinitoga litoralis]MBM7560213.1 hypothetical protein [Marinitoga litoralis]